MSAAIEVLTAIETGHRPAAVALADWGRAHRFAGSGDRAAIGNLVYDALRRKRSLGVRMGSDAPRGLVLAAALESLSLSPEALARELETTPHAPEVPTADEMAGLAAVAAAAATPGAAAASETFADADIPDWLVPSLVRALGADRLVEEGRALAGRAPVDVRVNTLKADREKVLKALDRFGAQPMALSPIGVRIPPPRGGARAPHVEGETGHGKGWFEVQDEGSQIAAAMADAGPRQQVLDICAGAGGKTLALAARMQNTGQIYAYDTDRRQLRPIFERLKRAGARNVQVLNGGDRAGLEALGARFDLVLVDAPCTGSGTWRRRPDAKWRLKPEALAERLRDQEDVLTLAAPLVKPGGRLVYVTCSLLPEENGERIAAFLAANPEFAIEPYADVWRRTLPGEPPQSADGREDGLLLTPARHATDGFYIASLVRTAAA